MVPVVSIANFTLSVPSIGYSQVLPAASTTLQQTITGIVPGSFHNVSIFASNEYGNGETASVVVQAADPLSPRLGANTDRSIQVTWTADPAVTAYYLEMSENDALHFQSVYLMLDYPSVICSLL